MRDYNFQKHMAHEERQDGCHSPAEVLGWVKGMQPEPALVHQAFSAICETRRLDAAPRQSRQSSDLPAPVSISSSLELWEAGSVEWFVIIRNAPEVAPP
jgi:hypothetical protein